MRPTYDLTVEGEHEFFANGILVHNCLKEILGTLRNSAAIDPNEALAAAIEGKDPMTAQIASRWMMSDLARQGKLDAHGRPTIKHGAVSVDLRKRRGMYGR